MIQRRQAPPEDFDTRELITLSQARRYLPGRKQGRPVHPSTIYRWAKSGKLRTVKGPGGTLYTTEKWVREAFTPNRCSPISTRRPPAPPEGNWEHDELVDRNLRRMGF